MNPQVDYPKRNSITLILVGMVICLGLMFAPFTATHLAELAVPTYLWASGFALAFGTEYGVVLGGEKKYDGPGYDIAGANFAFIAIFLITLVIIALLVLTIININKRKTSLVYQIVSLVLIALNTCLVFSSVPLFSAHLPNTQLAWGAVAFGIIGVIACFMLFSQINKTEEGYIFPKVKEEAVEAVEETPTEDVEETK